MKSKKSTTNVKRGIILSQQSTHLLCLKVLHIHVNYSLMSEEGQSKPSNLGQTAVQQWNHMSSYIQESHSSCIPLSASCSVQNVNLESVSE